MAPRVRVATVRMRIRVSRMAHICRQTEHLHVPVSIRTHLAKEVVHVSVSRARVWVAWRKWSPVRVWMQMENNNP